MPASPPSKLLEQAQQILRAQAAQPLPDSPSTPAELQRMVEELRLHRIELEMQQEALLTAQAEAESARQHFAQLYDFAPAALLTLRADGTIAQVNSRTSLLLGTTADRLTGRRFLLFVAPESREVFLAFFATVLSQPQRHTLELRLQTEAGKRLVAHVEAEAGAFPAAVHLAVTDLTEQRREAERRHRSDDRLKQVLAATGTGAWAWTLATNALEWDAQAQACFGRPHDPNPTSFDVLQAAVHPDDEPRVQRALRAALHHGQPLDLEHRVCWPDGSEHVVTTNGKVQRNALGEPECLVGLVRDVTDRCVAEQELDYQNKQLQRLLDNMPMLFVRLSPTGEYLEMRGAGQHRLGLPDSYPLVGQSIFDLFPTLAEPTQRLLAGESINFIGSAEIDGQRVSFQNYGFFDQQRQQGVLFAIDVTESEQMKERLRSEQEFTKRLLNHSIDGVAAFDHTGRLIAWNQAVAALTGRAEADALGLDVFACLPFERTSQPGQIITALLRGAALPRYNHAFTWPQSDRDVELTAIPLAYADGVTSTGGLLLLRDVTERNLLHAHATRLKARQQRETFRLVLMAQEVERKRIAEALHNGVGQLLYATKLHLEDSATTPGATRALALLEEAIKATRTVSFELTPGILEDFGLAVALQKLARNIPPDKLKLHVYLTGLHRPLPEVLNVAIYRMVQELLNNVLKHARAEEATLHVAYEDMHVHLSMEDDGGGFDVGTALGQAQGVGLASLYNRAALLGGKFELVSRPGRGTIATVMLPVAEE